MQIRVLSRLYLSSIVVLLAAAMPGFGAVRDCSPELLQFASDTLIASTESRLARFSGNADSAELAWARQLEVKDCMTISLEGRRTTVAIIGNDIWGEVVLLDSSSASLTVHRLSIGIPSRCISLGESKDVNLDGNPELSIYEASGSHGMYLVLVSISRDSLSFVRDEKGHYQFFASGGGIQVADLDGDSSCEIVLTEMVWGDDPQADANNPPKTVYRWRDGKYVLSVKVDSLESK